jgi:hypothetical protein
MGSAGKANRGHRQGNRGVVFTASLTNLYRPTGARKVIMPIKRSTLLADAVLAFIELLCDDEVSLWLEPYQNGREHGWSLSGSDGKRKAVFSEHRNTDQIVVYLGKQIDFGMAGNVPSDKVYGAAVFYSYDRVSTAARDILDYLNDK